MTRADFDPDRTRVGPGRHRSRSGATARRASWNLVDQAISSATNAGLAVVVARTVDDVGFGAFAVAFTVFALAVGVTRAIGTSPLAIRYGAATPEDFGVAAASALGTALALGVAVGLGCLGVGIWVGGEIGVALVAVAVVLPGLLVQEACRQVFFAALRPVLAALNDTVWAALQIVVLAVLLSSGSGTVTSLVLCWGAAAAAAALLGIRQLGRLPRIALVPAWLRRHRDMSGVMLAEFGTQQGAMQGAILVIGLLSSLTTVGALRGAHVLLGMTNLVLMAAVSFALPELSRRRGTLNSRQWTRSAVALSCAVTGIGFAWGLAFVVMPDAVGRALLGDTWEQVSQIMFAMVVGQALLAAGIGAATAMRAMDRAHRTFALNALQCPLAFVGGVVGVLAGGAVGAAWGFAVAYAIVAPLWWLRLRGEIRRITTLDGPGPSGRGA